MSRRMVLRDSLLAQHKYAEALADLNEAVRLEPQSSAVYNNRGDAHLDIGEPDLAIADYSTAINLDPNSARAYYNRANAYIVKGEKKPSLLMT